MSIKTKTLLEYVLSFVIMTCFLYMVGATINFETLTFCVICACWARLMEISRYLEQIQKGGIQK